MGHKSQGSPRMEIRKIIENLLYLPLDIPNPPMHEVEIFNKIDVSQFYRDKFRTCWHIPLHTDHEEKGVYKWSKLGNKAPLLKNWVEQYIFPMSGDKDNGGTRITILVTEPGHKNSPHIDCSPDWFHTLQHKFRYVLDGNVEDLTFLCADGVELKPKDANKPYMMNGKWPHEMLNTHVGKKFTLGIGSPWMPTYDDPKYRELIERSYKKYSKYYLGNADHKMVENWEELFENYEKGIHKAMSDYWKKDATKEF